MILLSVREYARLTTESVAFPSLDQVQIPSVVFEWLCQLCAREKNFGQLKNRNTLQLGHWVGVLGTPYGLQLEILPKTQHDRDTAPECRRHLIRMLSAIPDLNDKKSGTADLSLFKMPLTEWVARQFLLRLHRLIKEGLRFDYRRVEEEQTFLRGQLDLQQQIRQLPHRQHLFHIRYDLFSPDRAENRLLRRALDVVNSNVHNAENWRLATSLHQLMSAIPPSQHIAADLALWSRERLMQSYMAIRPWCELILGQYMPKAIAGCQRGLSMLFPMEELFEKYVGQSLSSQLVKGAELKIQTKEHSLCSRDGLPAFFMQPDLLVNFEGRQWVLDTKWKRLEKTRDISIQDVYQLYAYGQQHLHGQGDVMLIYPEHDLFPHPQRAFHYRDSTLRLLIATFNPEDDSLHCDEEECILPWLK